MFVCNICDEGFEDIDSINKHAKNERRDVIDLKEKLRKRKKKKVKMIMITKKALMKMETE